MAKYQNQRGLSLFLALIMMSIFLAMGLGLSAILVTQLKMLGGTERSLFAFYGADTGLERVLYEDKICRCGTPAGCCSGFDCLDSTDCDEGRQGGSIPGNLGIATYVVDINDGVLNATSTGFYKGLRRSIEISRP